MSDTLVDTEIPSGTLAVPSGVPGPASTVPGPPGGPVGPVGPQGPIGVPGPTGPQGPSTIALGTTTTGAPGSNAAVVNAGTTNDLLLNFTIPRGETGTPGAPGNISQLYSEDLNFTSAQQTQARRNLYAAPFDAMAFSGIQVNGGMEFWQESGGGDAFTVVDTQFVTDMWSAWSGGGAGVAPVITAAWVEDAPPGYTGSLRIAVTTALPTLTAASTGAAIYSNIEGYRISRLRFGTAAAQPLSIGFWVKTNRTGNYSGALLNYNWDRMYSFLFNVSQSGTWQFKTLTIPGATTGIWGTWNEGGMGLAINLAIGSNFTRAPNTWQTIAVGPGAWGATGGVNGVASTSDYMQITGVIMLPGIELPSAERAAFIMRSGIEEYLLCARYYQKFDSLIIENANVTTTTTFQTAMRTIPTVTGGGDGFTVAFATPTHGLFYQSARGFANIRLDARMK